MTENVKKTTSVRRKEGKADATPVSAGARAPDGDAGRDARPILRRVGQGGRAFIERPSPHFTGWMGRPT